MELMETGGALHTMGKLPREFYDRDALSVAQDLLGKVLVHDTGGSKLSARIVEAEAYVGIDDKAAHFYGGRRTRRVEVIYGEPGFSYVYFVYGMHYCFNIVTGGKDDPQAVLIRAAEPLSGFDEMVANRYGTACDGLSRKQVVGLTSGPGKLCRALGITRELNGADLCGSRLYLEDGADCRPFKTVATKRVGIAYAEEARDFPWRFYIEGNAYVSLK